MMDIGTLLDRFETLYPNNEVMADLRRSYTDNDLSSIFRLMKDEPTVSCDMEELRKAVMEQNLHSIFRVAGKADSDLKKLILEDNIWKLWPLLEESVGKTQFIAAFKRLYNDNIEINDDCFARGQLQSKLWLVDELSNVTDDIGTVFLCAGWYGTLATLLFESDINIEKIRSFDIDDSCFTIAELFNKHWVIDDWKFRAVTADIHDINFDTHVYNLTNSKGEIFQVTDSPDSIINTSCEHIENFSEWYAKIPEGKLVILQGNNFFEIPEHVNCHKTLNDFSESMPMTTTLYEGELVLPDYTRFMKIGYR